jgi:hypothetical protein
VAPYRQIRADFDRDTIVVYQAYNDAIADAALSAGRFVPPFSFGRMTWIKPSYLRLMQRSGWATKTNQTRILAVRITRTGWDHALSQGVLTSYESGIHRSVDDWRAEFRQAPVHVQWDPERSLRGKKLEYRAIQVGIGRLLIDEYVSDWIIEIRDLTELTMKVRRLCREGQHQKARRLLPPERTYAVDNDNSTRLGIKNR